MKNLLKNLFGKTKETLANASEDIKEVVDNISEDAGKMMEDAKEKLEDAREDFTEAYGEPEELLAKAKEKLAETGEKAKTAAIEGMARASVAIDDAAAKVKEEFTEHVGDPDEMLDKAKTTITEAGSKLANAAKEEWKNASEKLDDLKPGN